MSQKVEGMSLNRSDQRSTSRTSCFNVPFDRDTDFVHRPNITDWIKEKYQGPSNRMALVGLGGLGKSQVAIHFAHQIQEETPETSVYWVHASSKPRFEEGYRYIAERNELPRRNDPKVDVLALVRDWLQTEEAGSWLMILDNADDINFFYPNEDNEKSATASVVGGSTTATTDQRLLATYLPKNRNGSILVTSRSLDVAEKLTGSHKNIFQVSVMDDDQGLQLLYSKLIGECDESVAIELLQNLDFIPLAITQAAAYINRRSPRESVETYLTTFQESDQNKRNLLNRDAGDLRRDETVSNSVITTWQVTFEHIRREKPSAAKLLSFMSFFNPHGIPIFVLRDYSTTSAPEANVETASFEDDLDVLRGYSLVTVTASTDLCEMHAMVQACTRIQEDAVTARARLGNLAKISGKEHRHTLRCLAGLASALIGQDRANDAEQILVTVLATQEKVLGKESHDTLASMTQLAASYEKQGRYDEAEDIAVRVLEAGTRMYGKEHYATLLSTMRLAKIYERQGRLSAAEDILAPSVVLQKKVLGKGHPVTRGSMKLLGAIWRSQGRLEEASALFQ
ncbi:hypothetical protein FAVG1_02778 [Fusarium avenaceum]|nr:hypothetical protein FAVG1_02778 [Fusarium avenaceum]